MFNLAASQPTTIILLLVAVLTVLAFLIETLVEASFGLLCDKIPALTPYKWALRFLAWGLGILAAFVYGLDVIWLVGYVVAGEESRIAVTTLGKVLTGVSLGMGSNYVHELLKRILASHE